LIILASLPTPITTTTVEPLLFENIGQLVSGLSYVHTHIPINLTQLDANLQEYRLNILTEFNESKLQDTYQSFLHAVLQGPRSEHNTTLSNENIQFVRSKLATWPQIATIHLKEIDTLQQRVNTLFLTLPKPDHPNNKTPDRNHYAETDGYIPDGLIKLPDIKTNGQRFQNLFQQIVFPRSVETQETEHPRTKRFIPLIIAGIAGAAASATAGTAFGLVNKNSLETLSQKVNDLQQQNDQIVRVFQETTQDIKELQDSTHQLVVNSFMDRTFDSGIVIAKLRSQLQLLENEVSKIEDVIQQAQHNRLSINYLSSKNLLALYQQIQGQAKKFGYRTITERPSELFQLDASYTFDGKTISILIHVPIAPPDAFMRLYKLHPFPLPFDNGTLLTHNVKNEILAISNSNHRFTIQMSTVDLLACHQLGKTFLCARNGLLNKYPEDTCLGSLYHQKFELAHQLCDFKVEPAREFLYQLLNNWFMVYEPAPLTVPLTCTNGSHSELHVRKGISKFHLTAGCSADFPRYKLLSDISILIPQDYIQLEMDWDPITFLPGVREFLIPEIQKLGRMGATMTSLSTLQSMVASRLEDSSSTFHWIHFGFNSLTVGIMLGLGGLIAYRCFTVIQARRAQATARQVDLMVRTALNRTNSHANLPTQDDNLSLSHFNLQPTSANSVRYSTITRNNQYNEAAPEYKGLYPNLQGLKE